jgi:hypothetical protein
MVVHQIARQSFDISGINSVLISGGGGEENGEVVIKYIPKYFTLKIYREQNGSYPQ